VDRVLIVAAVVLGASAIAVLVRRRRPEAPTQARWPVPAQVDRGDFEHPETPWLVAVFSSSTCLSCSATVDKARVLAGSDVAVQNIDVGDAPGLHRRYGIDAVPVTVVVDGDGVVRASFVGEPAATDLWAAMAELRSPPR
jgi:hypothetical protein